MDKLEFIARVRYLGWICYQMGAGLPLHDVAEDYELSDERLKSLIEGTSWALENPEATIQDNHENWMKCKEKQGYTYGKELDTIKKTHPSMIPFDELSGVEKNKDDMDLLMTKLGERLWKKLNNT